MVFFKAKIFQLRSPFQLLIVNLVISDFVMIAFGAPWDLLAISQLGWKLGKMPCFIVGFIKMFCGCSSLLILTVLSVQRCLYVWSPVSFSLHGYKTPSIMIAICYLLSASFSIPPYFGWSEYVPEQCGLSCAPCFQDPRYQDYSIYILVGGFIIPTSIVLASSFFTVLRLRQLGKMQDYLRKKKINKIILSSSEKRATVMVIVMVFSFFAAWTGYSLICLLRIFGVDYPDYMVAIAMMTAKSSAWTNTLIYIGMNKPVRKYILPSKFNYFIDDLMSVANKDVETIHTRMDSNMQEDKEPNSPTEDMKMEEKQQKETRPVSPRPKRNQIDPRPSIQEDSHSRHTEEIYVPEGQKTPQRKVCK